ncbi:MAG: polysaccharide pyruvyl transferase CsaB, partial [Thermoanaerobaculia bacterium]
MSGAARHVLIAGYYGHGNAGDEAILAAMLSDLRSLGGNLTFTVAGGDPARLAADHEVRSVSTTDIPALAEAVRGSDLVILGGGGLFQDYWESSFETFLTPAQGGLLSYLAVPTLAALLGRPLAIYAVGVGPLRTEQGRRLTRVAFSLCGAATVRDPESLELLRELGLPEPSGPRIELAADPAFDLVPAVGEETDRLLLEWGVGDAEPMYGVALRHWGFGAVPGWEAEVARALDLFLAGVEGRVLFLPFHTGGAGPNEDDPAVHRRVRESLAASDRAILVERGLRPEELAGVLGRCRLVLAMRFHAALFALGAGVPTVALAYDPKVSALMAGAGLVRLSLPSDRWRAEALLDALRQAPDAREAVSGFAAARRPLARRSAELALGLLAAPAPELPDPRRFLAEIAMDKVLATDRHWKELERLRTELQSRSDGLGVARKEAAELRRELESARALAQDREARVEALAYERDALREQRDLLLTERNDVARRLNEIERTIAWRLVSRFWRLMRALFPEGSRRRAVYRAGRRLAGRLLRMGAAPAAGPG